MSAISLHEQVQFHAKYPLFDSQSDRGFTFSYVILNYIIVLKETVLVINNHFQYKVNKIN